MKTKYIWSTIFSTVFVTILLFFCSLSVLALDVPNPPKNGYVLDQTQTLTKEEIYTMNRMGLELQKKTKAQIAVLMIPTLEGEDVSDYANRVFRAWGIGDKEKNNGVLFLIATKDKQILDQYAIPYFQKGKFGPGVMETY